MPIEKETSHLNSHVQNKQSISWRIADSFRLKDMVLMIMLAHSMKIQRLPILTLWTRGLARQKSHTKIVKTPSSSELWEVNHLALTEEWEFTHVALVIVMAV